MIPTDPPTYEIGTTDYAWAVITDRTKQDLSSVGVELQVMDEDGTAVSDWAAAAPVDTTEAESGVLRAGLLCTFETAGWFRLRARVTDNPTVTVLTCGPFQVV
jgi:hypothetical protein